MSTNDVLSQIPPRVLIVSRRLVRKNKFVDFVGEYHLDLIVSYGAVPVIVPRVSGIHTLLDGFEPIHGVLLCEGEDIDPSLYESDISGLSVDELDEIRRLHTSDSTSDPEKDSIELSLTKLCLDRAIPYLGICRGSQVLNVACGGTLYRDVETEMSRVGKQPEVRHIDYDNYDGHRHPVRVVENTPLHRWFKESLENEGMEINVNSCHHQGVKRLAKRFVPMAYAKDGLIEAFYDPNSYDPGQGKFIMGLQFHPERMRRNGSDDFDYSGCPFAYKEFVRTVIAYQKKVNSKNIIRSFPVARNMYDANLVDDMSQSREPRPQAGADFLESIGPTVENAFSCLEKVKNNGDRQTMARNWMETMSIEQLTQHLHLFKMLEDICSQVMDKKTHHLIMRLSEAYIITSSSPPPTCFNICVCNVCNVCSQLQLSCCSRK